MVGIFDALSPWLEIILTILGFASAVYPIGRWIINRFNKRQDEFEIAITKAIGTDRKIITDAVDSAKSEIKGVKENQNRLHNDVVRVDDKVSNMDDKLDKHMIWSSSATTQMQTQIENNTKQIVKNDDRIDDLYRGLSRVQEPYTAFKKTDPDKNEEEVE